MEIKHHWKTSYPGIIGCIELVPTTWASQFALPNRSENAESTLQEPLNMIEFEKDLKEKGIFNPVVIEVERSSMKCRLVCGNHRLMVFSKLGIPTIPLMVSIVDSFNRNLEKEEGQVHDVNIDLVLGTAGLVIEAPSRVFTSLQSPQ